MATELKEPEEVHVTFTVDAWCRVSPPLGLVTVTVFACVSVSGVKKIIKNKKMIVFMAKGAEEDRSNG